MKQPWISLALLTAVMSLGGLRTLDAQDRMQGSVLQAFQDVVRQPAKSTVEVYADGYRSALGAIVGSDGLIVTKASELKGKIEVQLYERRGRLEATVVGRDPAVDLAVLKVDAKDLPVIAWSESAPPVGSWLATPGLYEKPVSIGVLSVAPRKIAAPNGALGIRLAGVDNVARIEDVVPSMAADKAGLKAGDEILRVNNKDISGRQQLVETIKGHMPGEKVELRIKRGNDVVTLHATLGNLSQLMHGERAEFQNSLGGALSERRAGFASVIQHDSVLRPADCGGPIVDLDGKAVGINIARAGRVESYALPASVVRESVAKLLETHLTAAPATEKVVEQKQ